ncbi:hypothetical protein COZ14_03640 [Candidatus Dojkabacteria bacterium CG_4_10_14_3_um_filter_Dojkabacteria_WS6_41_9]|uniref:Transcription elongation factor GreA n=1 Tax=Candidatus Dojkabacteria bacterium CG_4_10_14_0_2_um_filter_Dojkabacteria_WS6_41_15 TaxID=2014249 RepID=A0A2M7W119_9BACT|nr:MAG: hypothetical protein COZ14_03640 [Candidatus Dojkabacteria bacterium CG_4_10_14_3_um_filter_Dojkabacteria_WS6_41_9]PJA12752.1 MAG: hypothetical protein COX64_04205 [Candidatus Dojkabacteria bacterium CG_4_10_14_0_2_um_filter_Dojkabacteria_WS6_41_15]
MPKKQIAPKPIFLSKEKLKEIEQELEKIEAHILPEIRRRLAIAYEDGDLRENNPWESANNELQESMKRRNDLRLLLVRSKYCGNAEDKENSITNGSTLTISIAGGEPTKVTLVSSEEADPTLGKISIDSPIGKALLLKLSFAETPSGKVAIEILNR